MTPPFGRLARSLDDLAGWAPSRWKEVMLGALLVHFTTNFEFRKNADHQRNKYLGGHFFR
jgi:cobalamin biosynthesis protein CobD/CbiB